MKSHLFTSHDMTRNEDFSKDLQCLFALDVQTIAQLAKYVHLGLDVSTKVEADRLYESASKETGIVQAQLGHALDLARFFLREFLPGGDAEEDNPKDLVSDLREIFDLPADKTESVERLLSDLKSIVQEKGRAEMLKLAHTDIMLPRLNSIAVSVDFRVAFDEYFKSGQDIAAFSPRLYGIVPLGILQLGLSDSPTEQVVIQLSKNTLQLLIDHLVALQKQITLAEARVQATEE